MRDAFNTELRPESRVAWASRKGSKMWLSWGTVQKVDAQRCTILRIYPNPVRHITLHNFKNIVRIL